MCDLDWAQLIGMWKWCSVVAINVSAFSEDILNFYLVCLQCHTPGERCYSHSWTPGGQRWWWNTEGPDLVPLQWWQHQDCWQVSWNKNLQISKSCSFLFKINAVWITYTYVCNWFSRTVRWYLGDEGMFDDHKIAAYYRKLQRRHFTLGILKLYIIAWMLNVTFYIEGQSFSYCYLDNGDIDACDIGLVITGRKHLCVVLSVDTISDTWTDEAGDVTDVPDAGDIIGRASGVKSCSIGIYPIDWTSVTVSASLTEQELQALDIEPCSVTLTRISPQEIMKNTTCVPLILDVKNLCPTCDFPAKTFSHLSHHVKTEYKGQKVYCGICKKQMSTL